MPNFTTNYNLKKPTSDEFYNVDDNNGNADIIDQELKDLGDMITTNDEADAAHWADYMPHDSGLNQYASSKDANGIYIVIDFKRTDNTLYLKSALSNPDTNGNYQTVTWNFYEKNGTTLALTKVWTITYDADGIITTKVVA